MRKKPRRGLEQRYTVAVAVESGCGNKNCFDLTKKIALDYLPPPGRAVDFVHRKCVYRARDVYTRTELRWTAKSRRLSVPVSTVESTLTQFMCAHRQSMYVQRRSMYMSLYAKPAKPVAARAHRRGCMNSVQRNARPAENSHLVYPNKPPKLYRGYHKAFLFVKFNIEPPAPAPSLSSRYTGKRPVPLPPQNKIYIYIYTCIYI